MDRPQEKGRILKETGKGLLKALLPARLRIPLFQALFSIMSEEEKDTRRFLYQMADMWWSLRSMKKRGFSPKTIIDVGAYEGEWTRAVRMVFPESTVLMIEAQPEKEAYLRRVKDYHPGRVDYTISLLGAEDRDEAPFYITSGAFGNSTGSSVFEEESNVPRAAVSLPMRTLDTLLEARGVRDAVSLLKLDVQGYEIEY